MSYFNDMYAGLEEFILDLQQTQEEKKDNCYYIVAKSYKNKATIILEKPFNTKEEAIVTAKALFKGKAKAISIYQGFPSFE